LHQARTDLEAIEGAIPEQEAKLNATAEEVTNLADLYAKADRELQDALTLRRHHGETLTGRAEM